MDGLVAFSPVLIILLALLFTRSSVGLAGLFGLSAAFFLSVFYFQTSIEILLRSLIAGFLASLPVSMIVVASLLQLTIMETGGAMNTVILFSKGLCEKDKMLQTLILVVGFGTILSSIGAVPVTVITPVLVAMGYSSIKSISLAALGYDSLCTYTILGVPLVVFSDMIGIDLISAAKYFLPFVSVVSFSISLAVLYMAGGMNFLKRGFWLSILIGIIAFLGSEFSIILRVPVITGLIVGVLVVIAIMSLYKPRNGENAFRVDRKINVIKAISPWLILIGFILFVNLCTPVRFAFYEFLSMPIDLLRGKPVYLRVFWQAYTWIFVSSLISIFIYKLNKQQLKTVFHKTKTRVVKPFWSATIFFLIAYIMLHSGYQKTYSGFELLNFQNNMIHAMAASSAKLFKDLYPLFTPFLGVLGGFVTGTQTSATAMFANYTMETSRLLNFSPIFMTAAVAFGSGLASAISPSKLQNAAASIDKIGEERKVLPKTFYVVLLMALLTALVSYFLRYHTL
ncbi:L-lactate permease [Thermotoga profunda]|uniref:L-lactate permease n=1 Tax=Thermotoga profunda TaxID=1508420 RepID=UPI000596BAD7|nr:L-lactate permease [Thermotoga profunda]